MSAGYSQTTIIGNLGGDRTPDSDSDGSYALRHADNAEEEAVEVGDAEDLPW